MIFTDRVYNPPATDHGERFLVDRLWPRGVEKESAQLTDWIKEVGPSNELRNWFGHDPKKWTEFQRRYFAELKEHSEFWKPLLTAARRRNITLLFGAKDEEHNNAVALKIFLTRKLRSAKS
jgi:uncharacterized protein YeaO (DUF488 family)